ncbi:MAG: YicC family protein [Clostridiales bacterium]|nr:YicC family protein [Clostridiales bacterium]MBQ3322302.1 YicC family protein [Bacillota bacterium]
MIRSMTGFGRGEFSDGKRNVIAEIKTVNHRYADISIKMPKRYSFAEEKLKAIIKNQVKRGKVDVSIIVENLTEGDITISLNKPVADQYIERLRELKDGYDLEGEIDIKLLSSMPDVLKIIPDVADEEEVSSAICKAVELAAANLDEMRSREGEKLATDLLARGETIKEIVRKISERAPKVAIEYKEKMYSRIQDILEDKVDVPEERILVEAAIFADKASITEELVRLDSHMDQLKTFLTKGDGAIGKKLDFLVQEMNRETNTIGSKANDIEITSLMLDAKSEIEKIREQVQNIE